MGTHNSCSHEQSPRGSKMAQIAAREANRPCYTWWTASLFDRRLGRWKHVPRYIQVCVIEIV